MQVEIFQSQARCKAPGDFASAAIVSVELTFQSQARCQAPGDVQHRPTPPGIGRISISGEMPGPWRHASAFPQVAVTRDFNLRRDARPLATSRPYTSDPLISYFNLRRDARPLATSRYQRAAPQYMYNFNLR